jgi:hypothetical protein
VLTAEVIQASRVKRIRCSDVRSVCGSERRQRGVNSSPGTTAGTTVYISLQCFGGQKKLLACQHARLEELSLTAALLAACTRAAESAHHKGQHGQGARVHITATLEHRFSRCVHSAVCVRRIPTCIRSGQAQRMSRYCGVGRTC